METFTVAARAGISIDEQTPRLRWARSGASMTLQQAWIVTLVDENGKARERFVEWRDVPIEDNPENREDV